MNNELLKGVNGTNVLGETPPKVKYKIPEGCRLFDFNITRAGLGYSIELIDYRDDPSNTLIRIKKENPNPTADNIIILFDRVYAKYASRNWSSGGTSAQLYQRALYDSQFQGAIASGVSFTEPIIESTNCDEGKELSELSTPFGMYKVSGSGDSLEFTIENKALYTPTVSTICQTEFRTEGKILLPSNMIVSIPSATSYPGAKVTEIL